MSLNWDITNITDWQELTDGIDATITQGLVLEMAAIGVGSITEANLDETATRVFVYERLFGPTLGTDEGPLPLTYEHLRRRVGLRANVVDTTKAAFGKRVAEWVRDDARRELNDQKLHTKRDVTA